MSFEEVNLPCTTLNYPRSLQSKSKAERVALKGRKIIPFSAHMVGPQWLLDCCERGELVSEKDYLSAVEGSLDSKSDTSQSVSNSLTRQQTGNFNVDQTLLVRLALLRPPSRSSCSF